MANRLHNTHLTRKDGESKRGGSLNECHENENNRGVPWIPLLGHVTGKKAHALLATYPPACLRIIEDAGILLTHSRKLINPPTPKRPLIREGAGDRQNVVSASRITDFRHKLYNTPVITPQTVLFTNKAPTQKTVHPMTIPSCREHGSMRHP